MHPDELPFVVRRSRRISKESSPRRIMRLVPVFIYLRRITRRTTNVAAGFPVSFVFPPLEVM